MDIKEKEIFPICIRQEHEDLKGSFILISIVVGCLIILGLMFKNYIWSLFL